MSEDPSGPEPDTYPTDPVWRRWEEVDRVFAAALDLPSSGRETFVRERCRDDPELRESVLSLLRAERDSEGLFQAPDLTTANEALRELVEDREESASGSPPRVGSYRILRQIGRGGMGSVFLAERADADFEQRVAVKLLRRGIDTDDIVQRFLVERRILAGLTHPNIARLYDGGSTEDGRPFLVMEYVDGRPITEYCDAAGLPLERRLELFLLVADAVRYAHGQLVVHRDIKPSNILVAVDGRVKLLDFGIAKILEGDDAEEPEALTRTGVRILTPEYASPEQLRGLPVTTASDVYQLGVLLFVLLTGRRPLAGRGEATRGDARSVAATRASTAVTGAAGEAARLRGTTPDRLQRALRGDLDTILQKALREEPEARYTSAEQMADDVRRHLGGRPIAARPDTLAYRSAKFLRRNRWAAPVFAGGMVFLALYVGSSLRHAARLEEERNAAREQAERAEQVQRLLVDLFQSPDPYDPADPARGREITVVQALDIGARRVLSELEDRPHIQANLLDAIASVYTSLGAHAKALPFAERALALHERLDGPTTAAYREALAHLAAVRGALGPADSALVLFRRRLDLALADSAATLSERIEARTDLAMHLSQYMGRPSDALAELRAAEAAADSGVVPPRRLAPVHRGLSDVLGALGRPEEAEPHARRALALDETVFGAESPEVAMAHESLAQVLGALQQNDEAGDEFRTAVEILRGTLGETNGNTLSARNNYALFLRQRGDLSGAERELRRVLDDRIRGYGPTSAKVGDGYQNLGTVLFGLGRLEEAADMHRRAAAVYEQALEPGDYRLALPHLSLAGVELARAQFGSAEASARRALEVLEATLPAGHFAIAVARCRLGRALVGRGRAQAGLAELTASAEVIRSAAQAAPYREECLGALSEARPSSGG